MNVLVAIALGSNLGDRRAHLNWAIEHLREVVSGLRVSSIIETEPVGVPDEQPPYLNAVAVGETTLEPEPLLDRLLALERARGRERPAPNAARTLDLDVILYGDQTLHTDRLEIPHPRFRDRILFGGARAARGPCRLRTRLQRPCDRIDGGASVLGGNGEKPQFAKERRRRKRKAPALLRVPGLLCVSSIEYPST